MGVVPDRDDPLLVLLVRELLLRLGPGEEQADGVPDGVGLRHDRLLRVVQVHAPPGDVQAEAAGELQADAAVSLGLEALAVKASLVKILCARKTCVFLLRLRRLS